MKIQRSESFAVAALLAVSGGYLDAYTYLCRGGVFANAQTGNLVLLAINAAEKNWRAAGFYLIPVAAFALGVLAAELLRACMPPSQRFHWRQGVLLTEIFVLCGVSLLPAGGADPAVNVLVSFVCAMQVDGFRKVQGNAFASTMCTGNLRSGTEALYQALAGHDRSQLKKSGCYYGVIACFLVGAALGTWLSGMLPQHGPLVAAALQLLALALM